VLLFIVFLVAKNLVWDSYIVNPTPDDALKDRDGMPGIGQSIAKNQHVTIRPFSDGFKVFGLSKGYWGWSVTDESFLTLAPNNSYEITEKAIHFKNNKKVHYLFIATNDSSIKTINAYTQNDKKINFSMTSHEAFNLYYTYMEEPLSRVTYQATLLDGEVVDLH
jgi:hypothetical protein